MFKVKNETLLLKQGSEMANTTSILEALEFPLLQKCQTSLVNLLKNFTMVTDSAAVMGKVENASESVDINSSDET